ncbi:hypothetical protein [Marispirochaeta aestuarii]|uniref:hypothetical protein n=1 Tax=Marispirochaeta aestuarii TaxID=1963862 RepID=UPI002ABDAF1A|nr:hypothetical protein [Marispirochaeta aestuarii]
MSTGKTGERLLGVWASQASMTYNPSSEEDKYGWDSFIEFEQQINSSDPIDKSLNHIKCFIQVKTTKNKVVKDNISLKNWENMIKNPLPFFILGINLDENENPTKIFLTHIDEYWIGQAIQRIRKLGNKESLHKHTMQYKSSESDQLVEISGNAIKEKILSQINGSIHDYLERKKQWLETVGYKKNRGTVSFSINGTKEEIIDFSIGLKESIEVSKCQINEDIRFGVPGHQVSFDQGMIEIDPPGIDVTVKFSNKFYSIKSKGKLIDPTQFFGEISLEHIKVRIETQFYDLILTNSQEFTVNFKGNLNNIEKNFKSFLDYSYFILILHGIKEEAKFQINFADVEYLIPISEEIGESIVVNISDELLQFSQMIIDVKFILNYFNIEIEKEPNIDELFQYRNHISNIKIILDSRLHGNLVIRAKYNYEGSLDNSMLETIGDKIAIPRIFYFKINNSFIIVYSIYYGTFLDNEDESRQYKLSPRYISHEIIDNITEEFIMQKMNELSMKIEPNYFDLSKTQEVVPE